MARAHDDTACPTWHRPSASRAALVTLALRCAAGLLMRASTAGTVACSPTVGQPIVLADASATTLSLGLVGYWKLDETTAQEDVIDSSGYVSTGVPVNAPEPSPLGAPVRISNAGSRSFDGTNQLIALGNPPTLDFAGEVTLAAWVALARMPVGCAVIVSHGYRFSPNAELALRVSGGTCEPAAGPIRWSAGVWNGGATNHMAETSIPSSDVGPWIHLVGTFDSRAWHLYKNGIETSVHVYSTGATPIDTAWGIGGRAATDPAGDPRSFPGRLDDVRIYNRALSPSEVLELYHL